jgi:UDP-N-acetylmuramoyl-tripeptide--D-alanyl-D-alanine ligase
LKTEGNLNNEIGVPLTLLRLSPQHRSAVIEMGMNHPGELARLTALVDPDAALLTVIQEEHLEGLNSIEGVAEAEGELFRGLRADAVAVVNQDDPHIVAQAARSKAKKLTFGTGKDVDVRRKSTRSLGKEGLEVVVTEDGADYTVRLALVGEHNAHNATGAFALGRALGIPPSTCVKGLEAARPHSRRLNIVDLPTGVTLLDDCYNANPGSMSAALSVVHDVARGRRPVAVLGDMLELGSSEEAAHRALGQQAARFLKSAAFFGPRSHAAYEAARAEGLNAVHFTELSPLLSWLQTELKPQDVLLVKGSRGMRLERVVEALTGATPSEGH